VEVVVAPDKFKGSLTASQVAHHVATGLRAAVPGLAVAEVPVADGGDGTVAAATSAGYRLHPVTADGPTGEPVATGFAEREGVAVVELADVSGLQRLPGGRPAALTASSYGTGQVLRAALDAGCRRVVLAIGGSASTDGGAGLLAGLGARLLDAGGRELPHGGAALTAVDRLDLSGLHPAVGRVEVVVACDVDNPLLGPAGAAAVYGPQKGATEADVARLDAALARWARVVAREVGRDAAGTPGAGAAGGVGFAAVAVLRAELRSGADLVLELVRFGDHLGDARLVVTGEGSLDAQSLHGKAPVGVAAAAGRHGIPVVAVAGRCLLAADQLVAAGIARAYPLSDLEPDPARSIRLAGPLLERLAGRLAGDWLRSPSASVDQAPADRPPSVHHGP
jgi:glycerate kinase